MDKSRDEKTLFDDLEDMSGPKIYTVRELTEEIRSVLEDAFDSVWVEGEISNFRSPISGHYYMVLKDEQAQIKAVMFRPQIRYLRFVPEDGMKVIARGRIGVYAPRGDYQIILDYLEPLGMGALALAFEQLKRRLAAEGLFDADLKRPLPFLPQRVAVITSPTGAAIKDFLKVISRRFTNMEITVVPVRVQGEQATEQIIEALEIVNRELDVDVIVITRGGGSLEDLWPFNSEKLAHAIRRSAVPVVSAVGHEIDTTICDLAADLRAPTPSAAAEILVKEKQALQNNLAGLVQRITKQMQAYIDILGDRLAHIRKRLKDPRRRLQELWLRVDEVQGRLNLAMKWKLKAEKKRMEVGVLGLLRNSPDRQIEVQRSILAQRCHSMIRGIASKFKEERALVESLTHRVMDLSPLSILERGYSITVKLPQKNIVRSYEQVAPSDQLGIVLGKGSVQCKVEQAHSRTLPWEEE